MPDSQNEEIEVTPEMIAAGIGELQDRYSEDVFDAPEETVEDIFKAMVVLIPQASGEDHVDRTDCA